jgi:hypothetical protein
MVNGGDFDKMDMFGGNYLPIVGRGIGKSNELKLIQQDRVQMKTG